MPALPDLGRQVCYRHPGNLETDCPSCLLQTPDMKVQKAQESLDIMQEFRQSIFDFLEARKAIQKVERDERYLYADEQAFDSRIQRLQPRYQEARRRVARRIAEATEICDACGVPTVLTITAPPMFGGKPAGSSNIFQAVITENLPFDAQVAPQSVLDLIDQAIFACERTIAKQDRPPKKGRLPVVEPPTEPTTTAAPANTEAANRITGKIWNAVIDSLVKHIVAYVITGALALVAVIYHYFLN